MVGLVTLLSCLVVLGAALAWRLGRRPARALPARRLPSLEDGGEDLLPWSAGAERADALAAFYAYQMASSRIDRAG